MDDDDTFTPPRWRRTAIAVATITLVGTPTVVGTAAILQHHPHPYAAAGNAFTIAVATLFFALIAVGGIPRIADGIGLVGLPNRDEREKRIYDAASRWEITIVRLLILVGALITKTQWPIWIVLVGFTILYGRAWWLNRTR